MVSKSPVNEKAFCALTSSQSLIGLSAHHTPISVIFSLQFLFCSCSWWYSMAPAGHLHPVSDPVCYDSARWQRQQTDNSVASFAGFAWLHCRRSLASHLAVEGMRKVEGPEKDEGKKRGGAKDPGTIPIERFVRPRAMCFDASLYLTDRERVS